MCPHDHLAAQQYQPIRLEPPDQLRHRPALSRWQAGLPDVAKCLSCRPCLPQLTASFGHPPPAGGPAQRGQVKCDQQPEAYARGTGALGHGVQAGHCHHGCHHCEARWKWYTPEQALEQAYCGSRASMPRCLLTCAHVRLPSCMCGANSPPAQHTRPAAGRPERPSIAVLCPRATAPFGPAGAARGRGAGCILRFGA